MESTSCCTKKQCQKTTQKECCKTGDCCSSGQCTCTDCKCSSKTQTINKCCQNGCICQEECKCGSQCACCPPSSKSCCGGASKQEEEACCINKTCCATGTCCTDGNCQCANCKCSKKVEASCCINKTCCATGTCCNDGNCTCEECKCSNSCSKKAEASCCKDKTCCATGTCCTDGSCSCANCKCTSSCSKSAKASSCCGTNAADCCTDGCNCADCKCGLKCGGAKVATVRKRAPQFEAMTYHNGFKKLKMSDYAGKYVVLFFYPLDFTFVCPTEIVAFSDRAKEFREIGCEVVGCSIDSQFTHMEYTKKDRKKGGLGAMDIPLIADVNKNIARRYGCLIQDGDDAGVAFRGTYIIDKNQIVRHISISDLPVGRNVDEILRLVKAFQYTDEYGEVCPSSWKPGAKTMKADVDSELTQKYWEEEHGKQH
eukprot:403364865